MQSYLMETLSKTGVFIICAQVLIHFRPKASYEKYLKMLVSAMILIQLFIPVSELFSGEGEQTLAERVAWFEAELGRCMDGASKDYEERLADLEEKQLESVEQEAVTGMGTEAENRKQEDKVSVAPIAPINNIQISISTGGVENADISTGE